MNYIINPWWFYLLHIVDGLRIVMIIGIVGGLIAAGVGAAIFSKSYGEEEEKIAKKVIKIGLIVFGVMLVLLVICPSATTLLRMQLAKFATYENVADAYQAIIDGAKYILEGLK